MKVCSVPGREQPHATGMLRNGMFLAALRMRSFAHPRNDAIAAACDGLTPCLAPASAR